MPLGMEVGLDPGDFVFDGDPAPPRKKHTAPIQFLAHVCCGQTAGWIKMPLGMEVNLGPGDIVLYGVAAPPKRAHPPVFVCETAGWMRTLLGTEVDLGPGHIVLDGELPRERGTAALLFMAHLYCDHGCPAQLLVSSCLAFYIWGAHWPTWQIQLIRPCVDAAFDCLLL